MKTVLRSLCLLFFMSGGSVIATAKEPVKTVPNLDIDSYMGEWHQIAAIPAWFQRKCAKETKATYERSGEYVQVTNSCTQEDGKKNVANGFARINKKYDDPARLQVTFVNILGKWVWWFSGDYWVIDLDAEYTTSVVADPERKYLWILSREENLTREHLQELELKISSQHFDTCQVKITQEGEFKGMNLCSLSKSKAAKPE